MNIQIKSKASFINPWTKKPLVAGETVTVPFDNLCRSLLRDGSFTRIEQEKPAPVKKAAPQKKEPAEKVDAPVKTESK